MGVGVAAGERPATPVEQCRGRTADHRSVTPDHPEPDRLGRPRPVRFGHHQSSTPDEEERPVVGRRRIGNRHGRSGTDARPALVRHHDPGDAQPARPVRRHRRDAVAPVTSSTSGRSSLGPVRARRPAAGSPRPPSDPARRLGCGVSQPRPVTRPRSAPRRRRSTRPARPTRRPAAGGGSPPAPSGVAPSSAGSAGPTGSSRAAPSTTALSTSWPASDSGTAFPASCRARSHGGTSTEVVLLNSLVARARGRRLRHRRPDRRLDLARRGDVRGRPVVGARVRLRASAAGVPTSGRAARPVRRPSAGRRTRGPAEPAHEYGEHTRDRQREGCRQPQRARHARLRFRSPPARHPPQPNTHPIG